ncbi:MAG: type II toxin-antitoxin system HicB family antitoxin [Gemmataceae bacterium]|nr:type II toxin-antitoxin system HicB family antitoxin [Gemmataceae bacterium]
MKCPYSMVIQWSDDDQVYVVTLPEFGPYSKTQGSTYQEAVKNGQEVLELLIETSQADGEALPDPAKFDSTDVELTPKAKAKRAKR